uniref:Uncharacterized protein n=1 Tax=Romanomermis culicivorax TaxID=13658 RepID=A0A915KE37_ROMCU
MDAVTSHEKLSLMHGVVFDTQIFGRQGAPPAITALEFLAISAELAALIVRIVPAPKDHARDAVGFRFACANAIAKTAGGRTRVAGTFRIGMATVAWS